MGNIRCFAIGRTWPMCFEFELRSPLSHLCSVLKIFDSTSSVLSIDMLIPRYRATGTGALQPCCRPLGSAWARAQLGSNGSWVPPKNGSCSRSVQALAAPISRATRDKKTILVLHSSLLHKISQAQGSAGSCAGEQWSELQHIQHCQHSWVYESVLDVFYLFPTNGRQS